MWAFRWHYVCGGCGGTYDLPWVDTSFMYGQFLGVSRGGQAVMFDAISDPVFDQVRDAIGVEQGDKSQETLLGIISEVCDPDRTGDPYVFVGVPGCPFCGSTVVTTTVPSDERMFHTVLPPTHHRWDALTPQAKREEVRDRLHRRRPDTTGEAG